MEGRDRPRPKKETRKTGAERVKTFINTSLTKITQIKSTKQNTSFLCTGADGGREGELGWRREEGGRTEVENGDEKYLKQTNFRVWRKIG